MKKIAKFIPYLLLFLAVIFFLVPEAKASLLSVDTDPAGWSTRDVEALITNATNLVAWLGGGIAVVMIIWGGFNYLIAFGNEEKASQGKKIVTWAIVGLVVIVLARILVGIIFNVARGNPTPRFSEGTPYTNPPSPNLSPYTAPSANGSPYAVPSSNIPIYVQPQDQGPIYVQPD